MSTYKDDYSNLNKDLALKTISPKDEFNRELAIRKDEIAELATKEIVAKAIEEAQNDLDLKRIQRQNAINDIYNTVLSSVNSEALSGVIDNLMNGGDFRTSDLKNIASFLETLTKIENMNVNKNEQRPIIEEAKSEGVRMVVEFKNKDGEGAKMGIEHI